VSTGAVLNPAKAVLHDTAEYALPAFEAVGCLACGSTDSSLFLTGEDDLTGKPGRFTFMTCAECGLVYQSPRLTLDGIRPYYEDQYIAHQPHARWGILAPLFRAAMGSLDRAKLRIVQRHAALGPSSRLLDVGCGSGSFLARVRAVTGAAVAGVDFVDLSHRDEFAQVEFHHGVFSELQLGRNQFDVVTMWHFLEHDYDPQRSLRQAMSTLTPGGLLVIEVPRLDSVSFRLFKSRWPGVQAPQHTVLFDKTRLVQMVSSAGFDLVEHLPYGAFPPYFYLFCGTAFVVRRGRGLNLDGAIYAYFAGQLLALPILPFLNRMNFAMQTVICRRPQ
jgi:SAM-dependent methyltransferase